MHHVSAGISHLKDFSGASGRFSQRAKSHETLVGTKAMGKGGGRGSVFPMRADVCSGSSVKGELPGAAGGGGAEQRAQTFLCPPLAAESVPRTGTVRAGGESREQLRKHINAP